MLSVNMRRTTRIWLGLSGVVGLLGCTGPRPAADGGPIDASPVDFPILRERRATFSRLSRPVRLVIRDAPTFARLPLAEIEVDFDREMVLIVGLGPVQSDAFGIRITRVRRRGRRLDVGVETIRSEADAPVRGALASPYHLVVVPRSDHNVVGFETRVEAGLLGGR